MPPVADLALAERATPYALPKLETADSVAAKVAAGGGGGGGEEGQSPAPQSATWTLSAGRLATADGSGASWGETAANMPVRAITSLADAPAGVKPAVAAALVDLEAGEQREREREREHEGRGEGVCARTLTQPHP